MLKSSKSRWKKTLFGEHDLTYPNDRYLSYVTPYNVGLMVLRIAESEFKNISGKVEKWTIGHIRSNAFDCIFFIPNQIMR